MPLLFSAPLYRCKSQPRLLLRTTAPERMLADFSGHFISTSPTFNDARPVDKAIVKGQTFEEWAADHKDELLAQFDKQQ